MRPVPRRVVSWISAGQLLGISWYLPVEVILNKKNLPLTRSPLAVKETGCPRHYVLSHLA